MSLTYAIADLHGRHDLLVDALNAIREHDYDLGRPGGVIVTLGDYVDRGPQSRQVIETLMAGLDPIFGNDHGFELVCLQGNHEAMMLTCLEAAGLADQWWAPNGGMATLVSYGAKNGDLMVDALALVPQEHRDWLRKLPLVDIDDHRVYVHAGIEDGVGLADQDAEKLQWMIYPEGADGGFFGRHVVHGHDRFRDGPKVYSHRTDLDTYAWRTGRLVIGVFDQSKAGGAVDFITIQGRTIEQIWNEERSAA